MESNEAARSYNDRAQDSTASESEAPTASAPDTTTSSGKTFVQATDLTRFQLDLLATIAHLETTDNSVYGLGIKRRLERTYDEQINHGRLYPNLDTLVDEGLVAKRELDKRTNGYELTDAGRHLLRERAQWLLAGVVDEDDGGDA
ncbi:helix-turn-helix transcriptional regulator [haloarchaeon 3A1-DGR]|nr:helix-turn-helix transcriptional regulator [haloarchaeon 3A1-DGR]